MSTRHLSQWSRWDACFFKVTKGLAVCSAVFVLLLMLYIVGDVFGRYVFNQPLPDSLAVSETLMVCLAFLGLAYVQAMKKNIRLDFFIERLGPMGRTLHDILSMLLNLTVIGLILWATASWVWESMVIQDSMQGAYAIPYYYSKTPMFIGLVFLFLQFLVDLGKGVKGLHTLCRQASGRGH